MATPLRVKEKSAWKTLKIPQDLLDTEAFDGLVDIQELTDYELVPFDVDTEQGGESTLTSKKSRKHKRKRKDIEETTTFPANNDETEISQKAKKRRKEKKHPSPADGANKHAVSESGVAMLDIGVENNSLSSERSKKNKTETRPKKSLAQSRKSGNTSSSGVFVKDENVLFVEDGTSDGNDKLVSKGPQKSDAISLDAKCSTGERSELLSKKKRKRKKKASRNETGSKLTNSGDIQNVHSPSESGDKVVGDAAGVSEGTQKKKRKRKKKKVKQQAISDMKSSSSEKAANNVEAGGKTGDSDSDAEEPVEPPIKKKSKLDMSQWKNLHVPDILLQALQDQGFDSPTTIQTQTLPSAIRDRKDILGAAETGSGKTLAFGIPVLARILNWSKSQDGQGDEAQQVEEEMEIETADFAGETPNSKKTTQNPPLALILEPTRELAVQVKKHLMALAKHTDIRFATVVGGMSVEKQRRILGKKPQVVIATPGRLWQLIEEGNEHLCQVDKVLCLIVDEADRMIEKGHFEELTKLLEMMNKSPRRLKRRQTFVMSATLTMDVGAPKRLMNKMKKKVKEEDKLKTLTERIGLGPKPKVIDLTPKDKVAQTLTELRVNCKTDEKDFYLYYFLCQHPGRTLVFVNSKDCLRRLVTVFTLLQCSPLPLHADMHQRQRLKNLDRFTENSRGLLLASDVAARGLDIPSVDHVIHYQVPRTMENYVHRSGRTARASNIGLSVMLVGPEDAKDYRKIVSGVKNGEELPILPVEMDLLPAVKQRVGLARDIDVKEYRIKKKRMRNNFFTRAAEEMDMIVDDKNLLEDMGDSMEQAQDKHQLKQMKTQLASLLRGSLAPLRMTKYPTKSGQLTSKQAIDLHKAR